jgi:hypothetical protein
VTENIFQFVSEQVNSKLPLQEISKLVYQKLLFLLEEMIANVQKPGSAQRNIPSSKTFRTDFRINYANFFGIDN